jgi:1,4-alpha-glucan branching enzyme
MFDRIWQNDSVHPKGERMLRKQQTGLAVKVTFSVPDSGVPVSVVGEFNDWDPIQHPLKKRSNGTRSAAVELQPGRAYQFRYLADGGVFFDDDAADAYEPNDRGEQHCLVIV